MDYGQVDKNGEAILGIENDKVLSEYISNTGEFQKLQSVLVDGGDHYGVSTTTLDPHEELVWMGNQGGHVTSYYGSGLEKYTSFQVISNEEIRQILPLNDVVLILSQTQLRGQIRRGLPVFSHTSENLQEMQCMLQTSPTSLLMGGHQEFLVDYDLQQSREINTIHVGEAGCAILRSHGRYICAGEPTGQINLLDTRTLCKEQSIEAHSGSLSDFDVHGNVVVTCGFSSRHGTLTVDRFLKLFDLRVLRALAPISVSIDPYLLRFLPSFSSRIVAVSPTGQMEVLETQALSSANFSVYQVTADASMCQAVDVSSSCHHIAIGDSAGSLHLFSSNATAQFNSFSRDTEFPDQVVPLSFLSYTDELASLAAIPCPLLAGGSLLSEWPAAACHPIFRRAPEIDAEILESMKMVGTIGYAPNPGLFSRNQIPYKSADSYSENMSKNPASLSPVPMNPRHSSPSFHQGRISKKPFLNHLSPSRGGYGDFSKGRLPLKPNQQHPNANVKEGFGMRFVIPKKYCRLEWKKSIFEEGDMEAFNKTKFSGLEASTANSYCNTLLQILYHIDYLRGSMISHLCNKETCLSCELGFLFHMLDHSKVVPCVGSNFLRAFRVVPEASALGLILQESQSKQRSLFMRLIQSWNRFILHQMETDFEISRAEGKGNSNAATSVIVSKSSPWFDPIPKLFAMQQENTNVCTRCGREDKKESTVLLSNLLYAPYNEEKRCTFTDVLQRSLCPEQTTPAWCDKCEKYQLTFQSRSPKTLPPILSLNTCLDNSHDLQVWKQSMESTLTQERAHIGLVPAESRPMAIMTGIKSCRYGRNCVRPDCKFWHEGKNNFHVETAKSTDFDTNADVQVSWLPPVVHIKIDDSKKVIVTDTMPSAVESSRDRTNICASYELIAVVCYVRDPEAEERNNLVSIIKVDQPYFERKGQHQSKTGWFLFNDFCIREVPMAEAISFNPKWKIPCVVYYRKLQLSDDLTKSPELQRTISVDVFKENKRSGSDAGKKLNYIPLSPDEIPQKGELVAMDAEFVTLGQEETELRSDGKLATVKPQQLTIARVTCIRGQGPLEGLPFLDDYISTQEVVVDYLTKFSGIQPGDLDANFSSKNVAILKSVYVKLRFLVDSGVKFVGHGLNNDFRVINLVVPPEQVIDTVLLFYLPNQRMVSLRFLAWHFLGMVIQSDMHDSAEDARAALSLYRKYEEIVKHGNLDQALQELYEVGKKVQWKVPNESDK